MEQESQLLGMLRLEEHKSNANLENILSFSQSVQHSKILLQSLKRVGVLADDIGQL